MEIILPNKWSPSSINMTKKCMKYSLAASWRSNFPIIVVFCIITNEVGSRCTKMQIRHWRSRPVITNKMRPLLLLRLFLLFTSSCGQQIDTTSSKLFKKVMKEAPMLVYTHGKTEIKGNQIISSSVCVHCMDVCVYQGPLAAVSMEGRRLQLWRGGQPIGPHLPHLWV